MTSEREKEGVTAISPPPPPPGLQVAITVGDLNDEDPTFPLEFYTYHLPENTPPSTTPILTPSQTATDADLGSNSELVYSLAPPTSPSQPFRVVPSTGEVVLTASLDRETRDYYSLTLTATDQGTPSRPGSIELRFESHYTQ